MRRLAEGFNLWQPYATVLEQVAKETTNNAELRSELLDELAEIHETHLENTNMATHTLELLAEIKTGSAHIQVLERLAALYEKQQAHSPLARTLKKLAAKSEGGEAAVLYKRLAELYENRLNDAVSAYSMLSEAARNDPADAESWEKLDRLCVQTRPQEGRTLLSILQKRAELSMDANERATLYERMAQIEWQQLGELDEARQHLILAIDQLPQSLSLNYKLNDILAELKLWPELYEQVLEIVELEEDPEHRVTLLVQAGNLAKDRLDKKLEAFEHYKLVLQQHAENDSAAEGLLSLIHTPGLEKQVREIIEPVFVSKGTGKGYVRSSKARSNAIRIPKKSCLCLKGWPLYKSRSSKRLRQHFIPDRSHSYWMPIMPLIN
ncbi:MAG: hypothetical protein IPJ88_12870 [Myxococcales bacterium]|nr:MAG: hypothetical protein IPJ88_12870 [Myxococcales bacterium]